MYELIFVALTLLLFATTYGLIPVCERLIEEKSCSHCNRQLLHQVWGEGYHDMHILRVNISNLRGKLEPDPARPTCIHTKPGGEYTLKT